MSSRKTRLPSLSRCTPLCGNRLNIRSASGSRCTPRMGPTPQQGSAGLQPRTLSYSTHSPTCSKEHYANLDEKTSLQRLRTFLRKERADLTISKPVTISSFVEMCKYLLSLIEGPNEPPILIANYKTELPARLKCYGFPFTVQSAFLKCPYTLGNFKVALSIFIFLLDLIEPPNGDEVNPTATEKAYVDRSLGLTSDAELCEQLFAMQGGSAADMEQRAVALEKVNKERREELKHWEEKRESAQRRCELLQAEMVDANAELEALEKRRHAEKKFLKSGRHTLKELAQSSAGLQQTAAALSARLDALRAANQREGYTQQEYERLRVELAREEQTLQLRKARADALQQRDADIKAQQEQELAELQKMVFAINTRAMLEMPRSVLPQLLVDEDMSSLSAEKIALAHAAAEKLRQAVKDETSVLDEEAVRAANVLNELGQQEEKLKQEARQLNALLSRKKDACEEQRIKIEALAVEREDKIERSNETDALVKKGIAKRDALKAKYVNEKRALESKLDEMQKMAKDRIEHKKDAELKLVKEELKAAKETEAMLQNSIKNLSVKEENLKEN